MIHKSFTIVFLFNLILISGLAQPSPGERELIKARFLVSGQEYQPALAILNQMQPAPDLAPRWTLAKAYAHLGAGQVHEAAAFFKSVTDHFPAEATYQLCLISLRQKDTDNALTYLKTHLQGKDHFPEKRIKLDGAFAALENERAWIRLWQENWYTSSEQTIDEADYLISNGQFDEALESLENIPASDGFYKRACFSKGKALRELNQDRLALKAFDEALAGNRLIERQLNEALDYFFSEELPDLAAKTLNRLLVSDPANPEYLITKVLLQLRKGTGSSAVFDMNELEELGIGSAELYYQAGLKLQDKYPDQALIYFSEAITYGTMDARYYFSRGVLQCNHTQIESGLDDLAMSLDINPNQPDLYLQRGELRHALGDFDGACHDWKKALQLGSAKASDLVYKFCR